MNSNTSRTTASSPRQSLLILAWLVTLLVSFLPNIIWQETTGQQPDWLLWAKVILLAVLILLSFISKVIQPLRHYFALVAVLYLATELAQWIDLTPLWQRWFGGSGSFSVEMLGAQILRLATALVMIGVLLLLGYRRREFFLAKGELDAPAEREQWLGMKEPEPWTEFGRSFAIVITLVTLIFLVIAGRPSLRALGQLLPLLPMVLLLAAMNAFSEEMSYRAALLAPLHNVVGKQHAVFLTAVFFGLGHYYGVPYGIVGVLLAGFLGWLLGKGMIETRGLLWPWFIHFLQDVLIFSFMAIGSIVPGGG